MRFMTKDENLHYTQYLCFLPKRDNRDAGQLWKRKCEKAKSATKVEGGPINGKTCTEYKSIEFTLLASRCSSAVQQNPAAALSPTNAYPL